MIAIKFGTLSIVSDSGKYIPVSEYSGSTGYKVSDIANKGAKPYGSLDGPELRTRSFSIQLVQMLGVDPVAVFRSVQAICEAGTPENLYINGIPESQLMWVLTGCTDNDYIFGPSGSVQRITLQLTFKEFGGAKPKKKKKKKKKK